MKKELDLFAEEVANDAIELSVETLPAKSVLSGASTFASFSSFASGGSTAGTWSTLTSASSV